MIGVQVRYLKNEYEQGDWDFEPEWGWRSVSLLNIEWTGSRWVAVVWDNGTIYTTDAANLREWDQDSSALLRDR